MSIDMRSVALSAHMKTCKVPFDDQCWPSSGPVGPCVAVARVVAENVLWQAGRRVAVLESSQAAVLYLSDMAESVVRDPDDGAEPARTDTKEN